MSDDINPNIGTDVRDLQRKVERLTRRVEQLENSEWTTNNRPAPPRGSAVVSEGSAAGGGGIDGTSDPSESEAGTAQTTSTTNPPTTAPTADSRSESGSKDLLAQHERTASHTYPLGHVCEHDTLARNCDVCFYQKELEAVTAQRDLLMREVAAWRRWFYETEGVAGDTPMSVCPLTVSRQWMAVNANPALKQLIEEVDRE